MNRVWKDLVKMTFEGSRFEGPGFAPDALPGLTHFLSMIESTAIELEMQPGSSYSATTDDFRRRLKFRTGSFEEGCVAYIGQISPLREADPPSSDAGENDWDRLLDEAVRTIFNTFRLALERLILPDHLPHHLLRKYKDLGTTLNTGDSLHLHPAEKGVLPMTLTPENNHLFFILVKFNRPPFGTTPPPASRFGSARGMIVMAEDFDAPLEEFAEYME